ncbi:MAG: amino acid adenylation domain-containing protein, partial [Polyangiaceae bacterium]|nr:amino acid adenylation domain-containing protein [Polyangiaceae bacterium]
AEERRLPVRAVLLGSAVNNDGKSAALTAPNPAAHTALLLEAWSNAGVRPEDIGYIEAHGTGTYLGDPIEIAGIRDAFVGSDVAPQTVAIGSVKGNVGHLADGGAGVSGLLKLVYGIQRQTIPPTVHFDVPNTNIDFSQTPVFVVDEEIAWPQNKEGRAMIGGVSSFGFQGTNCHVVVGPAPTSAASSDSEAPFFWPVSASTDEALRETIRRHVRFLEAQVVDVRAGSFTLSMGRRHLPCRVLFFARSQAELLRELLTSLKSDELQTTVPEALWQDANERETLRGYVEGKVDSLAPLFDGKEQARISLPATAWNHRRHWLSTRRKGTSRTSDPAVSQAVTLEQVSSLFREVLSSEDVDDSLGFLELGGNSLLATLVIAKLRARFGVELSIRDFFQDSSVKGVLNSIASRSGISNASAPHRLEPRPSFIPLSFSQERLWYLHQLNPGLGVYNLPGIVKVKGPLGVQQVRDALSVLVSRHASFRTVFTVVDGAAQQTLRDSQGDVLTVVDLHDRPLSDALTLFREGIARPFDLEKGPLLRALLARCADETSLLLINTHHIVSDGASVRILVKELSALLGSHPLTSNADAVDYPDFSVWQRSPVSVARIGKQLLFWRSYLADAPATSELPTDFPRPSEQSFRGATHEYALPSTACTRLLSMAKAEGLTPFMAMLSVFRLTLGWWTEQDDFLLGTPVSNRTIAEVENIVGYFANTVTLRLKGSKFATLRDLFRDTSETCLHAFSNQDVPFEQVVADLHPMRDLSRQPLFQLNFAYEESTLEGVQIGPYWVEPVALDSEFTKFDLTFTMVRQSSGDVRVIVEYSSDLFEKATIDRFFSSFGHAMSCFTEPLANPAAFSPLPEVETKHLLLLGQGAKMLPGPAYLSAIGALLRKKPDVVWVRDTKGSSYTGRDLLQKIGDISGALEKHTRPGDAVGICLERTADLVAAVLAVLSTGRVYVPIEPEWPEKRTKFVEKDAGLRLVLVDRGGSRSWSTPTERVDQIPTTKTAPLFESIASDRPAYIIYTSGSTGNPKGVLIAHSQLQNYLDGCLATYPRGEGPSVVHSSIAFDLTLTSMFVPFLLERPILLVAGGLDDLANTILASSAISLLKLTPSHIVALSPLLEGEPTCRIGVVIVGGEALEASHVSSLRQWAGAVPMFNEYGPTETTVGCIVHETVVAQGRSVPIGKPMPNTTAYVLDRAMRLRPEGLVGDLWIGGSGVGVGYFGRPDLTGERFLGNPFGEGRIYKTGDRAQWKDGLLHFRGREDRQAKVNGFRIELEEIESVLTRVEGVDRAIVTARDGLEAYLLPSEAWLKRPENKLERVRWSSVFDTTYAVVSEESEDAFNITGWNDSYDNAPLPKEAMIEWRDETLARIRGLGGRSILEIGCGTGILLFPLSAHCDRYTGVDFSLQALASIDNTGRPSNVALHHRPAHDLRDLVGDTVVLNSVLQYFPSSRYLDEVLRAGIASAAKGGHFLIGDVRHAGLLDVFAASVLQHRTGTPPTVDEIAQYCEEESELVVHPAYFFDLPSRFDRVKHVEVMPKLCVADNELTRFRYDVVLHLDAAPTLLPGRVERWSSF